MIKRRSTVTNQTINQRSIDMGKIMQVLHIHSGITLEIRNQQQNGKRLGRTERSVERLSFQRRNE